MEQINGLNPIPQCRLCCIYGHHEIDILSDNSDSEPNNPNSLSAKIFRCVGIRVARNDKITTKICGSCVDKVNDIVFFRQICAATDIQLRIAVPNDTDGAIFEAVNELVASREASNQTQDRPVRSFAPKTGRVEALKQGNVEMDATDTGMGPRMGLTPNSPVAPRTFDAQSLPVGSDRINYNANIECTEIRSPYHHDEGVRLTAGSPYANVEQHGNIERQESERASETKSKMSEDDSDIGDVGVQVQTHHNRSENDPNEKSGKSVCKRNEVRFTVLCSRGNCRELFESWDAMTYHWAQYHVAGRKNTFQCHFCKKVFERKRDLHLHLNSVHSRRGRVRFSRPIRVCPNFITQNVTPTVHMHASHTERIAFKCSQCPIEYYSEEFLREHLRSRHGEGTPYLTL